MGSDKKHKTYIEWYEKNKEKVAAQQKEYYQNNKERRKLYRKQYYQNNKDKAKLWKHNNLRRLKTIEGNII